MLFGRKIKMRNCETAKFELWAGLKECFSPRLSVSQRWKSGKPKRSSALGVEIAAPAELSVEVFESRLRRSSALEVKFAAPVELSG